MNNTTLKKFSVVVCSENGYLQVGDFECTTTNFEDVWNDIWSKKTDAQIKYQNENKKWFKVETINFYKNVNLKELEQNFLSFDLKKQSLIFDLREYLAKPEITKQLKKDLRKFLFDE